MVPAITDSNPSQISTVGLANCSSRLLLAQELDLAQALFVRDPSWGEFYGNRFRNEAAQIMNTPGSGVVGVFQPNERLVGVGVAAKEPFDYAYWSLTWIFVDVDVRGAGFGRVVVDSLLSHIKARQEESHNPNARVLLSTSEDVEKFYQRGWGFKTLSDGPLPGERFMMLDLVGPGLNLRPR
jgi:ribosomal protein S18 acetylase RimI-like enzyme